MRATRVSVLAHNAPTDAIDVTLLELVQAICDETDDEREVVETVRHLITSGRVRLCGNFRCAPPSTFR